MMVKIENNKECFVQLWRRLERTRQMLGGQYKRFCIRNVLKVWFGPLATDDFIWEVCHHTIVDDEWACGNDMLKPPSLYPRKHREFLRKPWHHPPQGRPKSPRRRLQRGIPE